LRFTGPAGWPERMPRAGARTRTAHRFGGQPPRETAQKFIKDLGLDCEVHETLEQALKDPRVDIVNISGPNQVHTPQGVAAAEAGKHMLMEKTMCLSMRENRLLRDAVVRNRVKSVVSFVARWNPLVDSLKTCWRPKASASWSTPRSTTGMRSALVERLRLGQQDRYRRQRHLAGRLPRHRPGALSDRDEVVEVSAYSNNKRGLFEFDPNVAAILKFRGGAIGYTSTLYDGELPYQFNVDLVGTEGTLRDNRIWSKRLFPGQTGWTTMSSVMLDSGDVQHHPFDAEINHFVDCILADRESHACIADAYRSHELCMAIDQSIAAGGRPVRLPLEGDD